MSASDGAVCTVLVYVKCAVFRLQCVICGLYSIASRGIRYAILLLWGELAACSIPCLRALCGCMMEKSEVTVAYSMPRVLLFRALVHNSFFSSVPCVCVCVCR